MGKRTTMFTSQVCDSIYLDIARGVNKKQLTKKYNADRSTIARFIQNYSNDPSLRTRFEQQLDVEKSFGKEEMIQETKKEENLIKANGHDISDDLKLTIAIEYENSDINQNQLAEKYELSVYRIRKIIDECCDKNVVAQKILKLKRTQGSNARKSSPIKEKEVKDMAINNKVPDVVPKVVILDRKEEKKNIDEGEPETKELLEGLKLYRICDYGGSLEPFSTLKSKYYIPFDIAPAQFVSCDKFYEIHIIEDFKGAERYDNTGIKNSILMVDVNEAMKLVMELNMKRLSMDRATKFFSIFLREWKLQGETFKNWNYEVISKTSF